MQHEQQQINISSPINKDENLIAVHCSEVNSGGQTVCVTKKEVNVTINCTTPRMIKEARCYPQKKVISSCLTLLFDLYNLCKKQIFLVSGNDS